MKFLFANGGKLSLDTGIDSNTDDPAEALLGSINTKIQIKTHSSAEVSQLAVSGNIVAKRR